MRDVLKELIKFIKMNCDEEFSDKYVKKTQELLNNNEKFKYICNSNIDEIDFTQEVLEYVAFIMNLDKESIVSKSRIDNLVLARIFVSIILRKIFKLSYRSIGKLLNRRHDAIIHHCKLFDNYRSGETKYPMFDYYYSKIKNRYDI